MQCDTNEDFGRQNKSFGPTFVAQIEHTIRKVCSTSRFITRGSSGSGRSTRIRRSIQRMHLHPLVISAATVSVLDDGWDDVE
jgi:hypothetical protein